MIELIDADLIDVRTFSGRKGSYNVDKLKDGRYLVSTFIAKYNE